MTSPIAQRPGILVRYLALSLAWGSSFLFVAVALTGLSPAQVVLGRLVTGAIALAIVLALSKHPLPPWSMWPHLAVVALLLCVIPFLLFAWAQQHVSSGLASIYNATTPLMTVLMALAVLPAERPTLTKVVALALGFVGVVVIMGPWAGVGNADVLGQFACLGATACYGSAMVYMRRFISPAGLPAVSIAAVQVGIAAAVMLALAPFIALDPVTVTWPVALSILAMGIAGTALAYVWNATIVSAWGATSASTVTYITPVVGVILGVLVLSETLVWNQPVGAAIVVLGILLSRRRAATVREPVRTRSRSNP